MFGYIRWRLSPQGRAAYQRLAQHEEPTRRVQPAARVPWGQLPPRLRERATAAARQRDAVARSRPRG